MMTELESLRHHWGTAYWIRRGPLSGDWIATRWDAKPLTPDLRASSALELRKLIRADYKPVTGGVADVVRLRHPAAGKTTRVPPARDRGPS